MPDDQVPADARTGSFASNSANNVIAGLATTASGFISTILISRILGVEGTGVVAFATFIITVALITTDLGLAGALARYLPELRSRGRAAEVDGLTLYLFKRLAFALAALTVVLAGSIAITGWQHPAQERISVDNYQDSLLFWTIVAVASVVQGLAAFSLGYLRGTENFGKLARVAIAGGFLQIATAWIGGTFFGIAGAMMAAVLGSLIPAYMILTTVKTKGAIEPELKTRVNRFAWETYASYLVTAFAWSRMEIFFLERSWGSGAAGLFSVSLTLANLATQAPMLLTGAFLPYLSQHARGETVQKGRDAYSIGMRLMAFVVFPACLGMAAIAPQLLPLLFGADFAPAVPTAVILVSGAAFSATASVALVYLFAMERTRIVFLTGALGAVLSVAVGLIAVPLYGPNAAAIGRTAIQLMVVAASVAYIDRKLECHTPYGALLRLLIAAMLCAVAAFAVSSTIDSPAGLPVAILAGAMTYILAVKLLRALPRDDLDRLIILVEKTLPKSVATPVQAVLRFMQA